MEAVFLCIHFAKFVCMKTLYIIAILSIQIGIGQTFISSTILTDSISIRAIEYINGQLWYVGTQSKIGYVSLKNNEKQSLQISSNYEQFRSIALYKSKLYAISISSPCNFYAIDLKSNKAKLIFTDSLKTAFYDALISTKKGLIGLSDPDENLQLRLFNYNPKKNLLEFEKNTFTYLPEEAHFAASNSNMKLVGNKLYLISGGKASRLFIQEKKEWKVNSLPIIQGKSTQGAYTMDFYNKKTGMIAGGDYTKPNERDNNLIHTKDGGKTWEVIKTSSNPGYITCVQYRPNGKGKEVIAVGDHHISYSKDGGLSWEKISEEKGIYIAKWINRNLLVVAGKNKIIRIDVK